MVCLACRDASQAVQPTDARLMVFESVSEATTLWIKGEHFSLRNLCNNMWRAEELDGCSLVISRCSPSLLWAAPLYARALASNPGSCIGYATELPSYSPEKGDW